MPYASFLRRVGAADVAVAHGEVLGGLAQADELVKFYLLLSLRRLKGDTLPDVQLPGALEPVRLAWRESTWGLGDQFHFKAPCGA